MRRRGSRRGRKKRRRRRRRREENQYLLYIYTYILYMFYTIWEIPRSEDCHIGIQFAD